MAENEYFKQALSNFVMDVASGGAIKHLTNQGYTVQQIVDKLDFPTPYEKVQELVWKQLVDSGCVLLEEPGSGAEHEKVDYIQEKDSFGRSSFRRVVVQCENEAKIHWKERCYSREKDGVFVSFLHAQCEKNGEQDSYVSCSFGLRKYRDLAGYEKMLRVLNAQQAEYIRGLPWERKTSYHCLDLRMREIVGALYEAGEFQGYCYFRQTKEKIKI